MMTTTTKFAYSLIHNQEKNVRKIDGLHMVYGNHEYRIRYIGGFAMYIGIDRREIGKKKYQYFSGISAVHCLGLNTAVEMVKREIEDKLKNKT